MASILEQVRRDFPALTPRRGPAPIYFDNACMTLRPQSVLDAMNAYYTEHPACHRRAVHDFGLQTTRKYRQARESVQRFINAARAEEVIFNRNTTEGINLVAHGLQLGEGDVVLTSDFEHNSNLLPWQRLARTRGAIHRRFEISPGMDAEGVLRSYRSALDQAPARVRLVSTFQVSHVTGRRLPIAEMARIAHERGAYFLCDAAQGLLHEPLDVQAADVDFMAFSFHKALGPSGMGALYGKQALLARLEPLLMGGETIDDADYDQAVLAPVPDRFEAGLQNYAGALGANAALECIGGLRRLREVSQSEKESFEILRTGLAENPRFKLVGAEGAILNFYVEGVDSAELSRLLNEAGRVMTRSGLMCSHAWYKKHALPPSLRISLAPYNVPAEAEAALKILRDVSRYF